jgi:hypothetical protein
MKNNFKTLFSIRIEIVDGKTKTLKLIENYK